MLKTTLIGSKWKLIRSMLGVPAGSIGYCFNEYNDFDYPDKFGLQLIFQNGNYDGFSVEEQESYLEYDDFASEYQSYQFKNVLQVSCDFQNKYWKWSEE